MVGWLVVMLVNMFGELKSLISRGYYAYLQQPWTPLELVNYLIFTAAIGVYLARLVVVDRFLDQLAATNYSVYASFAFAQRLDLASDLPRSLALFLVVLKVFKILRYNRHFLVLMETFSIANDSIKNQTFLVFILIMAFGIPCYVLQGKHLQDYHSFLSTVEALFNFALGRGDFEGYSETQPVLGPIIYFLFVIFFIYITLAFFIAFLLESFSVAVVYVQLNVDEVHFLRYLNNLALLFVGATPHTREVRTHPFKAASYAPNLREADEITAGEPGS